MSASARVSASPAGSAATGHLGFWLGSALLCVMLVVGLRFVGNEYAWFAGYFILQYAVS